MPPRCSLCNKLPPQALRFSVSDIAVHQISLRSPVLGPCRASTSYPQTAQCDSCRKSYLHAPDRPCRGNLQRRCEGAPVLQASADWGLLTTSSGYTQGQVAACEQRLVHLRQAAKAAYVTMVTAIMAPLVGSPSSQPACTAAAVHVLQHPVHARVCAARRRHAASCCTCRG